MEKRMNPKIILEGTEYTFKTAISILLNEHPKIVGERKISRNHSPTLTTEWNAFTHFEQGKGVINFSEDELQKAINLYKTWLELIKVQNDRFWVIDGFHLATKVYQKIYNSFDFDIKWIEEKLKESEFKLVLCKREESSFLRAIEENENLNERERQIKISNLKREQVTFEEEFEKSTLEKIIVDVTHGNFKKSSNEIANWILEFQT
ncbi:MAG: hypothetical protein DWQ06_09305 [Calditrichaeota bacterium]|nr:MAG: hypothetical protein DWQ06_09305 [Calditrichota bacterium]